MFGLRAAALRFATSLLTVDEAPHHDYEPVYTPTPPPQPNMAAIRAEMFELARRMESQRDDWKARFFEQWKQHQNAQATLESHVREIGTTLLAAVKMVNELRAEKKLDPVSVVGLRETAMRGERVLRTSEEYGKAMRELAETAPKRDPYGQIIGWSKDAAPSDLDALEETRKIIPDPKG